MTDPRAGKTYHVSWEQWERHCARRGIDPRGQCEDGEDLGGGDSCTVMCRDDPPEEEDPDEEWKNARDAYCCTKEE